MVVKKNEREVISLLIQATSYIAMASFSSKLADKKVSSVFEEVSIPVTEKTDQIDISVSTLINMAIGEIADYFYDSFTTMEIAMVKDNLERDNEAKMVRDLITVKLKYFFEECDILADFISALAHQETVIETLKNGRVNIMLILPEPDLATKEIGDEVVFTHNTYIGSMLNEDKTPVWDGELPFGKTDFLQYYSTHAIVIGIGHHVPFESMDETHAIDHADILIYFPRDGKKYYIHSKYLVIIEEHYEKNYIHNNLKRERNDK